MENDVNKSEAFLPLTICLNFPQILLETKSWEQEVYCTVSGVERLKEGANVNKGPLLNKL